MTWSDEGLGVRRAKFLLEDNAVKSAVKMLNQAECDSAPSEFKQTLRKPHCFRLACNVFALMVLSGEGIVVRMKVTPEELPVDDPERARERTAIYERALRSCRDLLHRNDLPMVYFDFHPLFAPDGRSYTLPALLGMIAYWTRRVPPCAVLATGDIADSGAISDVGGLDTKVKAAHEEHGEKTVLVPPGNNLPGAVEVETVEEAVKRAFGIDRAKQLVASPLMLRKHGLPPGRADRYERPRKACIATARRFPERKWAMDKVDAFLRGNERGVVTITGRLGTGKTVLVGQLAHKLQGVAFFFGLGTGEVPVEEADRSLQYQVEPHEASRSAVAALEDESYDDERPRVVLLDEVDHVREGAQRIHKLFPPSWPRGLFFIISSNPTNGWKELLGAIPEGLPKLVIDLSEHSERVREDAIELARERPGVGADEAARYAKKKGYNLGLIGKERLDVAQVCDRLFGDASVDETSYARVVLTLLATAREPVGVAELRAAGLTALHRTREMLERLGAVLQWLDDGESQRVHLWHERARQELIEYVERHFGKETLVDGHARWAEASQKEPALPYGLRHAPAHHLLAGQRESAVRLLCEVAFLIRRIDAGLFHMHRADINETHAALRGAILGAKTRNGTPMNREPQQLAQLSDWRSFLLSEADLIARGGSAVVVQRALEPGAPPKVAAAVRAFRRDGGVEDITIDQRGVRASARCLVRIQCKAPIRLIAPIIPAAARGADPALDAERAVIADGSGLVLVDLERGERVASAATSEEVTAITADAVRGVVFGTKSGRIGVWTLEANAISWLSSASSSPISAVAWDDGDVVFGARDELVARCRDNEEPVETLIPSPGPAILTIVPTRAELLAYASDGRVTSISRDAQALVRELVARHGSVRAMAREAERERVVYALATGAVRCSHRPRHDEPVGQASAEVESIAGRNGTLVVGTVTGSVRVIERDRERVVGHEDGAVRAVALLSRARVAFGGESGLLQVVDGDVAEEPAGTTIGGDVETGGLLTLHEDGSVVLSTRNDQRLLARQEVAGTHLARLQTQELVSIGPDGRARIYADGAERQVIELGAPAEKLTVLGDEFVVSLPGRGVLRAVRPSDGQWRECRVPGVVSDLVSGERSLVVALTLGGAAVLWDLARDTQRTLKRDADAACVAAVIDNDKIVIGFKSGQLVEVSSSGEDLWFGDLTAPVADVRSCAGARWAAVDASGQVAVYADGTLRASWSTERPAETSGFVLDGSAELLLLDAQGLSRWSTEGTKIFEYDTPSPPVEIATAGKAVIVALEDGSLRWVALEDGAETSVWYGRSRCRLVRVADEGVWVVDDTGSVRLLVPLSGAQEGT